MKQNRLMITQGEFVVSGDGDVEISTLLGSCVSCCLWDPQVCVGGMNHMLLSRNALKSSIDNLDGVNELELVINGMIKLGASRSRLVAKVFGGAKMVQGLSEIGAQNVAFTLAFLDAEGIVCVGQSVGGEMARQLMFAPSNGVVRQRLVKDLPVEVERVLPKVASAGNDMEML